MTASQENSIRLDAEKAEIHQAENTMIESHTAERFAHLDEKKILRKMDMRLIPMLTLLYLLSYLDRESQTPFRRRVMN